MSAVLSAPTSGDSAQLSTQSEDRASAPAAVGPRIAIIQSCYVPWKGFFDLLDRCDEYVIFDTVQYAKRHWHNRNRIKTAHGVQWMSIPVETKARFDQAIEAVRIAEPWADRHWRTIESAYARAPLFEQWAPALRRLYVEAGRAERLTDVNEIFLRGLLDILGVRTRVTRASPSPTDARASARLLEICREAGAGRYLSGPSARSYLEEELFERAGIEVEWMAYEGYPVYDQVWPPFEHAVSILDLLFCVGPERRFWRTPSA